MDVSETRLPLPSLDCSLKLFFSVFFLNECYYHLSSYKTGAQRYPCYFFLPFHYFPPVLIPSLLTKSHYILCDCYNSPPPINSPLLLRQRIKQAQSYFLSANKCQGLFIAFRVKMAYDRMAIRLQLLGNGQLNYACCQQQEPFVLSKLPWCG